MMIVRFSRDQALLTEHLMGLGMEMQARWDQTASLHLGMPVVV